MSFVPNTTPTPNWLYNGEMKKMNETELKVVLLVTRKTLGWFDPKTTERKQQDYISQSQFIEFTGQSNRAIANAVDSCVRHGWIIARDKTGALCDTPEKRARRKVWYQLGNIFTNKISGEHSSQEENLVNILPKSGEHNDMNLVNNVHSTKEIYTKEIYTKETITKLFDVFWELYPRKVGKEQARKVYRRKVADASLAEQVNESVLAHAQTEQWKKDGGTFIPYPATFLNQERWKDEIITTSVKDGKYSKYENS